jgi:anti-sigma factor RsiW
MNQIFDQATNHDAVWLLIPWYVNGRIDEPQRARVDAHLRACQDCQTEVLTQRKICQTMAASNPDIEQLPTASLRGLLQQLDSPASPVDMVMVMPAPAARMQQVASWRWSRQVAASLATIAVATVGYMAFNHIGPANKTPPANYYTVTAAAPRVPLEVIRAVFTPAITVADMQRILNEAQLDIVAGPTPAGVYSLAKTSTRSASESLRRLRQHKEVLFAEPAATTETIASQ